jgi:hypothetical protein
MDGYEAETMADIWERDLTLEDFQKPGRRVEMHPSTDWWMRGDRFGRVTRIDRETGLLSVKLDKSGRTVRVLPRNIDPGSFNPNRFLV